jgi:HD-like signal output (HDOD) protein/CheY-like chemotaxis protein
LAGGHVVFVDDEPSLLSGLRRMLRSMGVDWVTTFADDAQAALAIVRAGGVDVVVTDMRMPGISGVDLLHEVRRVSPGTARLILSGQAEQGQIVAAAGIAHQFLSKPCPAQTLIDTVERVLAVRHLLGDEALHERLGGVASLPKAPGIHGELMAVLNDPASGAADVAGVVEKDPGLSAEVLKVVNSAFFGMASTVLNVEQATSLLGLDTIHALAVAGQIFQSPDPRVELLDSGSLRSTALASAGLAKRIAASEGWSRETASVVYLAAMLYDAGLLALAAGSPDGYRAYHERCAVGGSTLEGARQAEVEAFGVTVAEASAYLLALWAFPAAVVDCLVQQARDPGDRSLAAAAVAFARRRCAVPPAAGVTAEDLPGGSPEADLSARWSALTLQSVSGAGS